MSRNSRRIGYKGFRLIAKRDNYDKVEIKHGNEGGQKTRKENWNKTVAEKRLCDEKSARQNRVERKLVDKTAGGKHMKVAKY